MKPYFFILSLLFLLTLPLASCEREGSGDFIQSYFTEEFPGKATDLSKRLGSTLAVLDGNDTIRMIITYEKASGKNFITDTSAEDTLFAGKVYKYRGLYYFSRKVEDSVYLISAVKVKKDQIQGLGTEFLQMNTMARELEMNPASKLAGLVQKNKPAYALKPDREILSGYFSSMIDSLTPLKRISFRDTKSASTSQDPVIPVTGIQAFIPDTPLVSTVYPNPVHDVLNLKMKFPAQYHVALLNEKQEVVLQERFNSDHWLILMDHIPSGPYILRLVCDEFNRTESIRILVR